MKPLIGSFLAAACALAVLMPSTTFGADKAEKSEKADKGGKKAKPYTLKTCIVSDEKLGEMGEPYVLNFKGQEYKLCCKNCKKDFDKEPEKFAKKLAEATKKDAPSAK